MSRPRPRRPVARRQEAPGLTARQGALAMLDAVLDRRAMLEDGAATTGAERAEARGLAGLTLRHLGQIDAVLKGFVDRAPKGTGRQILRLMAAELIFAGTPAHAAVDLAVRLTQSDKRTGRLAGLVNAVGRRLADAGADLTEGHDPARLNTPGWLWERLAKDWGAEAARAIATAHMAQPAHDLTLATAADAEPLAQETGGAILPTGSLRLPGRPQITALPGFADGAWWVQDAAAALPARLIPAPQGKRVLDLCAAPGGKTLQLAAAGANVTALDISEGRLSRLEQNLARTGLTAELVTADALEWAPDTPFDVILLDAPCSATGTVRRHPDLPHRFDRKSIPQLAQLQEDLVARALGWLAPGGVLTFATCSLFKAEGEDVIAATLDKGLATIDPIRPDDGIPVELLDAQGCLRTRPDFWADHGGLDGFFAARLVPTP